jgi:hypothetical protein
MPDGADDDHRDQIAFLRQLAIESVRRYRGGFRDLERLDRDLKTIIWTLEGIADPSWTDTLISLWGPLEITYASALAHQRQDLTQDDESYVGEAVESLLAEFERYEIALKPDDKPREHDTVRIRQPLMEYALPVGATGTVVVDYAASTDGGLVDEYEVQFGGDGLLVNVSGEDVEIVWWPGYGRPSS